jgi:preprotein translocase subunit SecD
MDAGQWKVDLQMNSKGASQFSRVTGANVNKQLAIVLDSSIFSAPVIRQKIPHGTAEISGNFSADEAKGLAVVLRAGALPAPVKIIEERTVGPSLGEDSIKKGVMSVLISFLLIVIFMAIYYKLSGILADVALMLNILFTIAVMASINATLTLPGLAGLILTIGMSVDANVLIFERMREELAIGKTARSALEAGYNRAFVTILDSNLTTLITAFILLWVGSGMLKGFAITLSIGIITSMFTALFVTKVIQQLVLEVSKSSKISV